MEISKLTTSVCTKCNGQVIERNGLDGMELLCLNCGFGQIPNIIPTQTLADDSEDYQLRNRSDGWSGSYYNLHDALVPRIRGESGKTKQKVTKQIIDTWNRVKEELKLTSQEVNKGSNK